MSNLAADEKQPRRLLAVLAHPDDETFGMGGTLAMYAHKGTEVSLVCATRGEVGEMDEEYMKGFASIADRRESELRCAAGLLGIQGVYFMGYRDSGMPGSPDNQHPQALVAQPLEKVVKDVVHYIRLIKPQVVLTFDPIGGYRHPDHIAIQRATEKAFYAAGEADIFEDELPPYTPQKLYFHIMPHGMLQAGVFILRLSGHDPRHFGKNKDIDLESIAEVSFPTHAKIGYRPVAHLRDEASACHASQGGSQMSQGAIGWLRRVFASTENFMQAYPPPVAHHIANDLFEGVH
jgi:N-acetyl-1-D-myo-inositol-2-amino-2-deoxy-alpha-D-glucopyranoside deacetylase